MDLPTGIRFVDKSREFFYPQDSFYLLQQTPFNKIYVFYSGLMIIVDALQKKVPSKRPIWMMRQAGRYLPEYMEIRKHHPDFIEFCYNVDAAVEVTLQPIERFDFDAAIIFSDILVIPHALGQKVAFAKNHGPVLEPFRLKHIHDFKEEQLKENLSSVYEIIQKTRKKLSPRKALYGFSGSPWTLSCYMIEEGKSTDFKQILKFSRSFEYRELLKTLTHAVCVHLSEQIKAGANVVQVFDSWAMIAPEEYRDDFLIQPFLEIVRYLDTHHPGIPVVYYGRCSKDIYQKISCTVQENLPQATVALGIWQGMDLQEIVNETDLPLQGNLDPEILIRGGRELDIHVDRILEITADHPHIFNLGHGIDKSTPIEHVHQMVNRVRHFHKAKNNSPKQNP